MNNCLTKHDDCRQRLAYNYQRPTRLINVTSSVMAPNGRLVDGNGRFNYAALSYCWGGDTDAKLKEKDLLAWSQALPRRLPATLEDAIFVARNLGFTYMWVDAICIVQDSPADWARESGRMCDIYSGAAVTIAASSAKTTHEGFLHKCRLAKSDYCRLNWKSASSEILLRPSNELSDVTFSSCPLAGRGWLLQESLLSPRTLHFGRGQVMFDCPQGQIDEAGRSTKSMELYRDKGFLLSLLHEARGQRLSWVRRMPLPPVITCFYRSWRMHPSTNRAGKTSGGWGGKSTFRASSTGSEGSDSNTQG